MKIALLGYGKMGKMIDEIVRRDGRDEVILKINSNNRNSVSPSSMKGVNAAIDFSLPDSALTNAEFCLEAGIPLVIGTTGWYQHLDELKASCTKKNGAIVYASNFSIGVNIFFELNRKLASLMQNRNEYEPRITETHHTQKKDAPSGTAISLAKDILGASTNKTKWVTESSGESSELVILSTREGTVTGIHEVIYRSEDDEIQLRHEAFSRAGFARGALVAARWIKDKKGFYEFRDIFLNDARGT